MRADRRLGLLLAGGLLLPGAARAQAPLRIGMVLEPRALDPHLSASVQAAQIMRHMYDTLVGMDEAQRLQPALALAWAMDPADPRRWILRLRPGVRFHDGQPFGAADAIASLRRIIDPPGGIGGFGSYLRQVESLAAPDALTLEIRTRAPHPTLPHDLTAAMIVSRRAGAAPSEAFNGGSLAVGTGPYRLGAWQRGGALDLVRNEAWWGEAPAWARVRLLPRPQDGSRVAALLAGELDLIEQVPTDALDIIRRRPDLRLTQATTSRVIFLELDAAREATPFLTDAAGRPLEPNPLRDPRVRRALSLAIDRALLGSQVMAGTGVPAGQLLPEGLPGTSATLRPDPFDPAEARRLLREAGLPEGTRLALHGPNDRYLNDEKVLVAIAGMWRRVGLAAEPQAMPFSVLRSRAGRREMSAMLYGWSTETADASLALRALLGAPGRPTGWGQSNFFGNVDEGFEAALAAAMAETAEPARLAALAAATESALAARTLLPLYFQRASWASRAGIAYRGRTDEYTLAISAYPL